MADVSYAVTKLPLSGKHTELYGHPGKRVWLKDYIWLKIYKQLFMHHPEKLTEDDTYIKTYFQPIVPVFLSQ